MIATYYFCFGSYPELSYWEFVSLVPDNWRWLFIAKFNWVVVYHSSQSEILKLAQQLAGCLKVLLQKDFILEHNQLMNVISKWIIADQIKRLSIWQVNSQQRLDLGELKDNLKELGVGLSYIDTKGASLSASIFNHHEKVVELVSFNLDDKLILAKTVFMQDIDNWKMRDRNKPYVDRKKGMLTPKLARMMVNIARAKQELAKISIYDPFCGTGTILMEAKMIGVGKIFGSDIDENAIIGARSNLEWLSKQYGLSHSYYLKQSEVTKVPADLLSKVNLIVTEPYLGKPLPKEKEVKNIKKGLEKLYLGAFYYWLNHISRPVRIMIVLPKWKVGNHWLDCTSLIDKISKKGYNLISNPREYGRVGAVTWRQLFLLELV